MDCIVLQIYAAKVTGVQKVRPVVSLILAMPAPTTTLQASLHGSSVLIALREHIALNPLSCLQTALLAPSGQ